MGVLVTGVLLSACLTSASAPGPPSPNLGIIQNRMVPAMPMVNQHDRPTTLASFRGKTVIVAPMLTLCQEVCPLTTQNLLLVQRAIDRAGLAGKVAIVEYSVDPQRDTPARLAAYARLTGASWTLLTGTQAQVDTMNKFFYVYAQKVPEGTPPQIDWWTHKPLTYDVAHTDGYLVIDASGHERFATTSMPDVTSHTLPRSLRQMLDTKGLQNLNDPAASGQTWTVSQLLSVVGWLVHRNIPAAG